MFKATRTIARAMEDAEIKYTTSESDKSSRVKVIYSGDNVSSITIVFVSTDDDPDVAVRSFSIATVPENKKEKMLKAVNELNNKYRYAKFLIDDDNDINAEYDMPLRGTEVGTIALEMTRRFVNIIDKAYPVLMQALWA